MKLKSIKQTCESCPSQWEARTEDDRPVYIRYRWGELGIGVGKPGEPVDAAIEKWMVDPDIYTGGIGDGNGYVELDEVMPFIEELP